MADSEVDFRPILEQFVRSVDALRGFVETLGPVLEQNNEEIVKGSLSEVIPYRFGTWVIDPNTLPEDAPPEVRAKIEEARDAATTIPSDTEGMLVINGVPVVRVIQGEEQKFELNVDAKYVSRLEEIRRSFDRANTQIEILYESSIISLITFVEQVIARLLHAHFRLHGNAVGTSDKVYSLEDLLRFGSIEEARQSLIDSRVENVMRDSVESWLEFLTKNLKLKLEGYLTSKEDLIELFQRRNLLVHNAGS